MHIKGDINFEIMLFGAGEGCIIGPLVFTILIMDVETPLKMRQEDTYAVCDHMTDT